MSPHSDSNRGSNGSRGRGRVGEATACKVLIAVPSPPFERLLQHVLHGHPGLRVVGRSSTRQSPTHKAARLAPDVIIASTRLLGKEPGDVLADLRRSSPSSTLILLTHGLGEGVPPEADACLPEDAVVRRLVPVIRKVADRVRDRMRPRTPRPGRGS